MKDIEYIEELLNSYIDGELDERKSNEVRRLIENDAEVRQFYDSLTRYKKLVGSVPPVSAPEGFAEGVAKRLERQILLADTGVYHHHAGRRHLILRRLMTAAAIIVLGAVLSLIVFDIFVPKTSRDKLVDSALGRKQKPQVFYEKPFADAPPAEDKPIAIKPAKVSPFPMVAKLTLTTDRPVETDWLIGKALTNTGLFDKTVAVDRKTGSVKYVLNCGEESLVSLINELSFIWPKCSDAKLEVGTEQAGKYVAVNNITAQQTLEICKADSYSQRIRMANDLAIINDSMAEDVVKKYLVQEDINYDLLIPDKPVLTSAEKTEPAKAESTAGRANFTIIVIGK
ncbi:MAG: hypothetical protein CVV39_04690 [Planctomycetes bacterium HGW-Planctomycetes-1]|nr:MAG: hypothetical protein CVV39_04690 [Planctomycetes bacterium HGW-Planctomycetes-1]